MAEKLLRELNCALPLNFGNLGMQFKEYLMHWPTSAAVASSGKGVDDGAKVLVIQHLASGETRMKLTKLWWFLLE
jgi:hypothetical protein